MSGAEGPKLRLSGGRPTYVVRHACAADDLARLEPLACPWAAWTSTRCPPCKRAAS
jgi:hypothetical protein